MGDGGAKAGQIDPVTTTTAAGGDPRGAQASPRGDDALALEAPRLTALLAAAPHRLPFLAGVVAVLASMAWWTVVLVAPLAGIPIEPSPIPAGWGHAISMQYQVLPLFVFGFLLTVMPKWTGQAGFGARNYLPAGLLMLAGYVLTLAGLLGSRAALVAGAVGTLAAYVVVLALLARVIWNDAGRTYHAVSCYVALALGGVGFALYAAYLATDDARFAFGAIKLGAFAFLLPMYATVSHRMVPFFTSCVVPGYAIRRPGAWLAAIWTLAIAHALLELAHAYAWLWPVDAALALATAWIWLAWQPGRALRSQGLLAVLYIAFAWLPVAFALYALQSAWFAATGDFVLGRAPVHALSIGWFGSMLVAMVTRVTQGHSGRPLEMGGIAWFAFAAIQLVALVRIAGDLTDHAPVWHAVAAIGWLVAFAPWALRCAGIYLTPRVDGKPG